MSDVSHIKLCIDYEPTNNAMTFGLLTVIPVKPQLSALINHDAFQRLGHEHSDLKATQCAIDRNYFLTIGLRGCCCFLCSNTTTKIYFGCSAGLNWFCRGYGRVLALHYCQQLGLSLWPFYGYSSDHNDARWLHCDWIVQKHIKSRKQSAFRTHYRPDCISKFWMFTNTVQYRTLPRTKLDIWINLPIKFNAGRTN